MRMFRRVYWFVVGIWRKLKRGRLRLVLSRREGNNYIYVYKGSCELVNAFSRQLVDMMTAANHRYLKLQGHPWLLSIGYTHDKKQRIVGVIVNTRSDVYEGQPIETLLGKIAKEC